MPEKGIECTSTSTVVIGAGPAGLSVGACLKRAQISTIILEKEDRIASSWAKYYERLHLNTDKYCSSLPYFPFPSAYPKYPSRLDVLAYLKIYARHFGLTPRLKERVLTAQRRGGFWETRTSETTYRSTNLVVASGSNQHATIPNWKDQKAFQGAMIHSTDYKNGSPFKGQNVLVVGIGNTGGEIARDLYEHGAQVSICIRGPVNALPRDIFGVPVLRTVHRLTKRPMAFNDYLRSALFKLLCYNLPQYGFVKPSYDPITQTNRFGKLPLIDNGTVALIKKGAIKVYPEIVNFSTKGIEFENGDKVPFDAVVLATGYHPRLDAFLKVDPGLLDQYGRPRSGHCITALPGLYFCGFSISPDGILSKIGEEALHICQHIIENNTE